MKFSESWLRSFVNPNITGDELSHLLTMAGLEVEEESTVAPAFDNVVIAQVLEVNKHPDADRLNVCRVDAGQNEPLQIVCGAPNVAAGLKVPCALPGAKLPGNFTIKVAKVRGIESSGMLCSAKELGIAEEASGLLILPADASIGLDIRSFLDLNDRLLTLKLTPNRADCLSLTGIAREVSALTGAEAHHPEAQSTKVTIDAKREIILEAPEACPLYCGRIVSGVNAKASTPEWMKRRLERSGIRSISALVDITNYVMLELGQPLHAFDNAKLAGAIHARLAEPGEQIQLLNEQTLGLQADVLLIADDKRPLAMAGIMGGEDTGINLDTTEVFLESAFFAPKAIAGRARRYGFGSDASHRFERGVDFGGTRQALERATQLIIEICGGNAGPITEAKEQLPVRPPVSLRTSRVVKVLGVPFSSEQIGDFFARLGLPFVRDEGDFVVTPPSYRFDIEIEEDLIEEIARLHGYDNIQAVSPRAALTMLPQTEDTRPLPRIRQALADRGFQEVINYAFIDASWEDDFSGNTSAIRLANPIASHMSVMRSTLIGGLISNVVTNLKRKQTRVRLFETGRCFFRDPAGAPVEGFRQPWKLAALAYGPALPEQWGVIDRNVDFYDIKGELELLMAPALIRFEKFSHPALHPGRSAKVTLQGKTVGFVGELHPEWQQKYDLPSAPVIFEVDLEAVKLAKLPTYVEVSRQPPAIRDLAVVVDHKIAIQSLLDALNENRPSHVQEIRLFDVYAGKGIEAGKKSLALRIVMQDTQRTLQEAEVDDTLKNMVVFLQNTFDANLRV
ncbi:phenylalanine--tRNA ligase subunit beta [Propionivibrio limicola]|uniref:phenylalanine--tRNA ligase subunit beta n=1 Tax=Propionivibrio limicola TaxID=167645 RepID=UPI0012910864|nr:phenylalanine--tRNA ligase subunit beta [Propionivibrio limicola]